MAEIHQSGDGRYPDRRGRFRPTPTCGNCGDRLQAMTTPSPSEILRAVPTARRGSRRVRNLPIHLALSRTPIQNVYPPHSQNVFLSNSTLPPQPFHQENVCAHHSLNGNCKGGMANFYGEFGIFPL